MASSDYQNVLWEAAENTNIPDTSDEMCWPTLKAFLSLSKVDPTAHKPEEWLKSFERVQKLLRKAGKSASAERVPSAESGRGSDIASMPDSGYDSSSPYDNVCCALLFSVMGA
jgi:hypothetical protein